ncbi:hypothetical protein [Butyrivibrio fibrisolvens]|uniref:hypothetical protein n=1 Tax=Butyrivibrio fibrisolvens TaxID=831 RepID=UPI0003B2EB47|nr:hypothetical protein [Butyrivibrio fibrisolvens]
MENKTITLQQLLNNISDSDRNLLQDIMLRQLPEESRRDYEAIVRGEKLPSFMSDIVAKKLFDADEHKDRLQYLFREVSGDDTIVIDSSFRNEGYIQSALSKKVIFDMTSRFHDGRSGVAEFQVAPLEFTFERIEIYGSNLLMLQYSVNPSEKKSELSYDTVKGVLLLYLMKVSPKKFKDFETDHYIHRFKEYTADSGLTYLPLVQKVFVQLDKCLEQFLEGEDGENNQQLQLLLSLLADSDNSNILDAAQKCTMLKDMIEEARMFVQRKEVQMNLLEEKFYEADLNAAKAYVRKEAREEGREEERSKNLQTAITNIMKKNHVTREEAEKQAKDILGWD